MSAWNCSEENAQVPTPAPSVKPVKITARPVTLSVVITSYSIHYTKLYEEIAVDDTAVFQYQRLDVPGLGIDPDIADQTLGSPDTACLAVLAQKLAVQRCVEVVGSYNFV